MPEKASTNLKVQQTKAPDAVHREARPAYRQHLDPFHSNILDLQKCVGNQAVNRLLRSRLVQAKLTVSQPTDQYEQEADMVAEQVMRMPDPAGRHEGINQTVEPTQRKGAYEESEIAEESIQSSRGGGAFLPCEVRAFMEPRFGSDFSDVRVHANANATSLARAMNAQAFTIGRDIFFGAGCYSPDSYAGKSLIAHEMVHVLQQTGMTQAPQQIRTTRSDGLISSMGSATQVQRQQAPAQQTSTPQYQIVHGNDFHQTLEGVTLNATLLASVTALSNHLIQNNLVNGNVLYSQGVRSPAVAHRWSTAWSIRNDRVPLTNLQALQNGNDLDGNHWYTTGWTMDQAKQMLPRSGAGLRLPKDTPRIIPAGLLTPSRQSVTTVRGMPWMLASPGPLEVVQAQQPMLW